MPNWSKYEKKYKVSWEELPEMRGWLKQVPAGNPKEGDASCTVCNSTLRPHLADLKKHALTKVHISKMECLIRKKQRDLPSCGIATTSTVSEQSKVIDLQLALHIAMHSSIRSIDHLGELVRHAGVGSKLEHLRLHRTKCTSLIKSVLAPAMLTALINDIGNQGYSLILDESTDISVCKYMCVCVRYFSEAQKKIVTDYLGIIEVVQATAVDLFNGLSKYLQTVGLKLENIVGLGTDGGSNLCGKNHSVFTLIKEKVPNVLLVKCVCHSIHLCSSKAAEELPSSLDYLVREVYNWFSCSPLRRHKYREIYGLINEDRAPLNLVQLSQTRWLSRFEAVSRIIDQWVELKAHFIIAARDEKCYAARLIVAMLQDHTNYLYLLFVKPLLRELNSTNLLFQHTTADVSKVYGNLKILLVSCAQRIVKPDFLDTSSLGNEMLNLTDIACIERALENPLATLPKDRVDFGILFFNEASNNNVTLEELDTVKTRCMAFLHRLCKELVKRLPENMAVVTSVEHFTPASCLNQVRPAFAKLPLHLLPKDSKKSIDLLEMQWGKLLAVSWAEHFPGGLLDTEKFWAFAHGFTDAGGRRVFHELSEFVLRILSLPLSNATVERAFSIMNATKTKPRNRLNMKTLDALMRIRIHSATVKMCCNTFTPSPLMLSMFTSDMYLTLTSQEELPGEEEQPLEEYDAFFQ